MVFRSCLFEEALVVVSAKTAYGVAVGVVLAVAIPVSMLVAPCMKVCWPSVADSVFDSSVVAEEGLLCMYLCEVDKCWLVVCVVRLPHILSSVTLPTVVALVLLFGSLRSVCL